MSEILELPSASEYPSFFSGYLQKVKSGNWKELHSENSKLVSDFFTDIPEALSSHSYAEGKWSIETIFKHIIDTERIFAYRALIAARNDKNILLQSYNDDDYAASFSKSNKSLKILAEEFMAVRQSNFFLFESFTEKQWLQTARTEKGDLSARACFFILLGHPLHHMEVIKERYL